MPYISRYPSPLGDIFLSADAIGLTGLWFADHRDLLPSEFSDTPVILAAKKWLDIYFSGQIPDFIPPLHPTGTPFQLEVWNILRTIPYGQSTTYGEIAKQIAARRGISKLSPQAVGGAVGRNKIGIIIPCHRVIGTDGSLTGYAGGLDRKVALLRLEGIKFRTREPK